MSELSKLIEQPSIRKFLGNEIHIEIARSIEALLPGDVSIVTFSAGENMPIKCAFVTEDYYSPNTENNGNIPEYAWNGQTWDEIGVLA